MLEEGNRSRSTRWKTATRTARRIGLGTCAWLATIVAAADPAGSITSVPLASRAKPVSKTMFVQRSPDETGIRTENKYADPKMWGSLYAEFEGGSLGTGVTIGDYDGDSRPDLFVVSKTESCRLFRNLGDFKFQDVTEQAGVGDAGDAAIIWKEGATFVDVNNDGRLDLYVCRFNAPNLLYINQGSGSFKEAAKAYGLDVKDCSVMASFCDYDRDGWLDVYIATNLLDSVRHPTGERGYLFRNNRDGTFSNATDGAGISGLTQSHSATWWDFDNDRWPDLYVANDYGVPDKLYRNNHDGTFTDAVNRALPHTAFYSMGSDYGDVNNDGLIDFYVADMAATTHEKDQRGIADARGRTEELADPAIAPKAHRSALLINTGTGRFMEGAYLAGIAASDWTWSVRLEDLDNDGLLDVAVTNGYNRDPSVDVAKRMRSAESPAERIRIMRESPVLNETHLAFRNRGNLQFENVSAAWGLDQKGVSFGAAFGDFLGNGNLDLVYSNYESGVTVLRNDNAEGHRITIDLRGTVSNRFGVGATVKIESALGTQIRQLGLARGYMSSSEPVVHFGLGGDPIIRRLTVSWPSGHVQSFENLAVDVRYTITEPSSPASLDTLPVSVAGQFTEVSENVGLALATREEPIDETATQKLLPTRLNRRGPAIAVGTTKVGGPQIAVFGGTTVTPAMIMVGGAGRRFSPRDAATLLPLGVVDDGPVLLFDADGDGNQDLLITKGGNALPPGAPEYEPRLFLGDGDGTFHPAGSDALPPVYVNAGAVAAADFDRDGRLDLFIGGRVLNGQYPLSPDSVLLLNRGGKFEDVTDQMSPGLRAIGMVTSALCSDVDGDGWIDLLLTLDWGNVHYLHNVSGRSFEDWTERSGFSAPGTGWWTSSAGTDFNGDGRIDYVVGNVGLNTQYHADATHPALLFSGAFKEGRSSQLIEGYYEGDRLYPRRSKRDLGAVIPAINKRYPRNDFYARATLGEIVGEDKLTKAQRFAATELRSGVFLSQADGSFKFQPLPHVAQIAPLQGMVTGDFDGDGHADLYSVQNSYAPIPAVGRFDGGVSQLLRGDGHGTLTPVAPAETNLVVPGDAKGLAILDLDQDGWADFLVTQNNSRSLAFRNGRHAAGHSLQVNLHGAPGNPTAVGACITLECADGARQTSEVYAGSGYYSQSSPGVFFGYREDNPPKRLLVRWPTGTTTEHAVPLASPIITLSAPST